MRKKNTCLALIKWKASPAWAKQPAAPIIHLAILPFQPQYQLRSVFEYVEYLGQTYHSMAINKRLIDELEGHIAFVNTRFANQMVTHKLSLLYNTGISGQDIQLQYERR